MFYVLYTWCQTLKIALDLVGKTRQVNNEKMTVLTGTTAKY